MPETRNDYAGYRLVATLEQDGRQLRLHESTSWNPEIFLDGLHGVQFAGATVKLNCFTRLFDAPSEDVENRLVVCRLVMGLDTFFSVATFLSKTAEDMKQKTGMVVEHMSPGESR